MGDESREFAATESPASLMGRLRRGLARTQDRIAEHLGGALVGRTTLDEEVLEALEESLLAADLGVAAVTELMDRLRDDARPWEAVDPLQLKRRLVDELSLLLLDAATERAPEGRPLVTLVVGVNGSGKTTTIAKLAHRARRQGERVLLAAADTYRAAAVEQLATWAERIDAELVRQAPGADPGAVVFDALQAARARQMDQVFVDTAGRLHTKKHLMAELAKVGRVVEREVPEWPRQVLLVLDATTGQNAIAQAAEFRRSTAVDGVVLAKLDGTAKGGMAVAVARELRLPVRWLGVGESLDDLVPFRPREFAAALLG